MKTFLEYYLLNESIQITHIDPENDWEHAEALERIANKVKIRPDRNKEPTIIALNDKDEVIGGVFTSWSHDEDASNSAGEPIAVWSYDVVVDPEWQGHEMIGMRLIQQAEAEKRNLESMYEKKAYTRLWVVNPKLARVLQRPRYGFNAETEYEDGSAHLVRY
jgi:hypothetical protein